MLFGDTDSFAVEIHHEPESLEWIGFGRMCIHIQGLVLGDLAEEHCSLFHAVERIGEVSSQLDELWDERFTGHTPEEIFNWLDACLYSGELKKSQDIPDKFDFLTNTGEQFDNFKSFVYCELAGTLYLPFQDHDSQLFTPSCKSTEFKVVSDNLHHWFKDETIQKPPNNRP